MPIPPAVPDRRGAMQADRPRAAPRRGVEHGRPPRRLHHGLIVDLHLDLLLDLALRRGLGERDVFRRRYREVLEAGGVRVQVLPTFVDDPLVPEAALRTVLRQIDAAWREQEESEGALRIVTTGAELAEALELGRGRRHPGAGGRRGAGPRAGADRDAAPAGRADGGADVEPLERLRRRAGRGPGRGRDAAGHRAAGRDGAAGDRARPVAPDAARLRGRARRLRRQGLRLACQRPRGGAQSRAT